MSISEPTRVLLADDHVLLLDGLQALLERQTDITVVATANDGRAAIRAVREHAPDVVVMDAEMPEMNGLEATRRITRDHPAVKVLCLSMHASPRFVEGVLKAGACGYLVKECSYNELADAIRHVTRHQTYLSPSIAGTVVDALRGRDGKRSVLKLLSGRELEVLQLFAEGYTRRQIAERLHLSVKTIATHREHLMEKLGIHNIAGLTKLALLEGLTSPDPRDHTEN